MKTYKVFYTVTEETQYSVHVEAESPQEALDKVMDNELQYPEKTEELLGRSIHPESRFVSGEFMDDPKNPEYSSLQEYETPIRMAEETTIREILDRMDQGQDCTDEESAEIKGYLKEQFALEFKDIPLINEILFLFPAEYREAEEEFAK